MEESPPVVEEPEYKPFVLADPELLTPPNDQRWWLYDHMFNQVPVKVKRKVASNPDRFETITEMRIAPFYSVQEVAKFFFGRTPHWLRWRYLSDERVSKVTGEITIPARHPDGFFILDGEPLEPKKSISGYRYYTLPDVERMAAALGQTGAIDGFEVSAIVSLVRAHEQIWRRAHPDVDK